MMKKFFSLSFLALAFLFVSAFSCDNDKERNSRLELVLKSWRVVAIKYGASEQEDPAKFQDLTISFTSDGKYVMSNPQNVEAPSTIAAGTWQMNATQSQLIFNGENAVELVFLSNDGKQMQWEWEVRKPGKTNFTCHYDLVAVQ